ncbi:MAG: hypothetical protein ABSH01_02165 [Terriglobia bacterium]|jgi:hypothetical protein
MVAKKVSTSLLDFSQEFSDVGPIILQEDLAEIVRLEQAADLALNDLSAVRGQILDQIIFGAEVEGGALALEYDRKTDRLRVYDVKEVSRSCNPR